MPNCLVWLIGTMCDLMSFCAAGCKTASARERMSPGLQSPGRPTRSNSTFGAKKWCEASYYLFRELGGRATRLLCLRESNSAAPILPGLPLPRRRIVEDFVLRPRKGTPASTY